MISASEAKKSIKQIIAVVQLGGSSLLLTPIMCGGKMQMQHIVQQSGALYFILDNTASNTSSV